MANITFPFPLLSMARCSGLSSSSPSYLRRGDDELLIRQAVSLFSYSFLILSLFSILFFDDEDHLLDAERHFSNFKSKLGETYATGEGDDCHVSVFVRQLARGAKLHRNLDPSATHGITKFSDLTPS